MQRNFDELQNLQHYELIMLAQDAVIEEIQNTSSDEELENIPLIKNFLITASLFDMEIQNGGLCQFLVNQGRVHGAMLENALLAFGAERHWQIVSDFCLSHGIDLGDPESLMPGSADPYRVMEYYNELSEKYPFEEFDKVYFEYDRECPLERILGTHIRDNMALFFGNELSPSCD